MEPSTHQNLRERAEAQMRLLRDYLLQQIGDGKGAPSGRLPTERALADRFKVARHSVRKILNELEMEGKITRAVGRGTFVTEGYAAIDRYKSMALDVATPAQVIEVRLLIEPRIARLAAVRGTAEDFERISSCIFQGHRATHWAQFEKWDDAFHIAIVASTKNDFLYKLYEVISKIRREAPWGRLKERTLNESRMRAYLAEHREVADALKARDGEAASEAMTRHLRHVQDNLLGQVAAPD